MFTEQIFNMAMLLVIYGAFASLALIFPAIFIYIIYKSIKDPGNTGTMIQQPIRYTPDAGERYRQEKMLSDAMFKNEMNKRYSFGDKD